MFALEDLDPRFGRIEANYKTRNNEDGKLEEEIKLVPCNDPEYIPNGPDLNVEKLLSDNTKINFLCPDGLEKLDLEGDFGAERFSYVSIKILGCDQSALPKKQICASDEEIAKTTFNLSLLQATPNILGEDTS